MLFKKIIVTSVMLVSGITMVSIGEAKEELKIVERNGFHVIDKHYENENESSIICEIITPERVGFDYDEEWQVCENSFDYRDYVVIENEEGMKIGDKYILDFEDDDVVKVEKYETK